MERPRGSKKETEPYLKVFTPRLLRVLALSSLVVTAVLFAIALLNPNYFEIDNARFMLCAAIASSLSIFFFVFYPQSIELNLAPFIGASLRVVGPVVLWFGVLLFLLKYMPVASYGRIFRPVKDGHITTMVYGGDDSTTVTSTEGKDIKYYLIPNVSDRKLIGIYVEFDRNVQSYRATLHHEPFPPIDIRFSREGPNTFDISKLGEK